QRVAALVRRPPQAGTDEICWNPAADEIDAPALEGVDAVVHLGGVNIAGGRWTAQRKAAIRDSRVASTRLLSQALAQLKKPPRTFLCASATGFYGDRGDDLLTEESPPGKGFLPDVCQAWEVAAAPARQAGLRVVNLRIGIVLSRNGGALKKMLPPFKMGLGGVVGSGRQYMSWITLDDLVRAIDFLLRAESVSGPVNAVTPNPVTNREFTRNLGRILRRPTIAPLPGFVVRALFGEMGQALLWEGNRVLPTRLEQARFSFLYPELESALRRELNL
ncbi:MAG: TIGR01777 family oxidoreductase, partial [Phycisphaerae bacterium]